MRVALTALTVAVVIAPYAHASSQSSDESDGLQIEDAPPSSVSIGPVAEFFPRPGSETDFSRAVSARWNGPLGSLDGLCQDVLGRQRWRGKRVLVVDVLRVESRKGKGVRLAMQMDASFR